MQCGAVRKLGFEAQENQRALLRQSWLLAQMGVGIARLLLKNRPGRFHFSLNNSCFYLGKLPRCYATPSISDLP